MRYVVAFYEIDQAWGGPEEGGWYFATGELLRPWRVCRSEDDAVRVVRRANRLLTRIQRGCRDVSSVLYQGGRYSAQLFENSAPKRFPEYRPVYE